jgi:hypothetical protein
MTDKERIALLEELLEREKNEAKEGELRTLAFVIERFCGGKIEFSVEDIASAWDQIDIQRIYIDEKIIYITRPAAAAEPSTED